MLQVRLINRMKIFRTCRIKKNRLKNGKQNFQNIKKNSFRRDTRKEKKR